MSEPESARKLETLAKSRSPEDRGRLLVAVADACAQLGKAAQAPAVEDHLNAIMSRLLADAEAEVRRALAERIADADWPPADLVRALAEDEIEIARPVIAASPRLAETDLTRLLRTRSVEHQIEVAQRPGIGEAVVSAVLESSDPSVLTALAGNDTAAITPEAMETLIERARDIAAMRSPLARHPRLSLELGERLYAFVGASLKSAIAGRFRVDPGELDRAVAAAVRSAGAASAALDPAAEQAELERRLILKLHGAGQLRPSYLLRALREQRLDAFVEALATLGGFLAPDIRKAIDARSAESLALACLSVGVDRGAFATLLGLVRGLNDGRPGGDAGLARRVFSAFRSDELPRAAEAFRRAATQ